jgi:tRNA threonylcarbamoyladenosine biosynthesis protein TsaE
MEETESIGALTGKDLMAGQVIGLVGDLGAGKTCFTRGLFKGRNKDIKASVNSPTFVVMQRYLGDLTFYHADVYRIVNKQEFLDLDLFEMAESGVLIVEWADKFLEVFNDKVMIIEFIHQSENERLIRFYKK